MLTAGTKRSLAAMSGFCTLLDWRHFSPRNMADDEIEVRERAIQTFACRDEKQAVVWLLRGNAERNTPGILPSRDALHNLALGLHGWSAGHYDVEQWDTLHGRSSGCLRVNVSDDGLLNILLPVLHQDLALAVRRVA